VSWETGDGWEVVGLYLRHKARHKDGKLDSRGRCANSDNSRAALEALT